MSKKRKSEQAADAIDALALKSTQYIGSPLSLFLHTVFFIGIFVLGVFGISFEKILLILTTAVSLEAIYLAIFIQISVNKQAERLEEVSEEVEEISEDVEDLAEEVEEISEDIEEDDREDALEHAEDQARMDKIEAALAELLHEVKNLKSR